MSTTRVRVWDLPTRIFHWSLAALFVVSWISAEIGELDIHFLSGYGILTLVLFRLAWGLVGSSTSRFRNFVTTPWRGLRHVARLVEASPHRGHGHSPSGGWMVLILLAALLAQACMGLFATDELLHDGPLNRYVSSATAEDITDVHETLGEILPWLIGLHVAVVLWIVARKKEPILGAMVSGVRRDLPPERDRDFSPAPLWRAGVLLGLAAAVVATAVNWPF